MYREYPTFLPDEILEYLRKSRSDDPTLTVEEVLAKHKSIDLVIGKEFEIKHGDTIRVYNFYGTHEGEAFGNSAAPTDPIVVK